MVGLCGRNPFPSGRGLALGGNPPRGVPRARAWPDPINGPLFATPFRTRFIAGISHYVCLVRGHQAPWPSSRRFAALLPRLRFVSDNRPGHVFHYLRAILEGGGRVQVARVDLSGAW